MNKIIMLSVIFYFFNAYADKKDTPAKERKMLDYKAAMLVNIKCIKTIVKLDILPEGYGLVATRKGGIVLVTSSMDGAIHVTNGQKEAAKEVGTTVKDQSYPQSTLKLDGSCSGNVSFTNLNGTSYLMTSLATFLDSKNQAENAKAAELIENCKDAPAFSETVSKVRRSRSDDNLKAVEDGQLN